LGPLASEISEFQKPFGAPFGEEVLFRFLVNRLSLPQPLGGVERSDTHQVVASPCWRARMTDYRRDFTAECGFFFEWL
jgi:hypothetical protein